MYEYYFLTSNYDKYSDERKHRGVRFCAARKPHRDAARPGGRSGGHMCDAPEARRPPTPRAARYMSELTVFHAKSKTLLTSKRY